MKEHEFTRWWTAHREAFPGLDEWLGNQRDPAATLDAWREVCANKQVQLSDALAVTKAMLAGDIDPPAAYEREKTPAIVARHAREMAYRRRVATDATYASEAERSAKCEPLGQAYREAKEVHAAGGDVNAVLRRYFDAGPDIDDRRVRYSCATCQDTGLVTVVGAYTIAEVEAIANGGPMRKAVARCRCRAGASVKGELREYDSARMCRLRTTRTETITAAAELLEELRKRREERTANPFAAWNERGA